MQPKRKGIGLPDGNDGLKNGHAFFWVCLRETLPIQYRLDSSMTEMESQLQSQFQEYQQKSTTWPQQIKTQKEQQRQQAQEDLTQLEQSRLRPFDDRTKKAVEAVAKKKGMDHVAAIRPYLYSNPKKWTSPGRSSIRWPTHPPVGASKSKANL